MHPGHVPTIPRTWEFYADYARIMKHVSRTDLCSDITGYWSKASADKTMVSNNLI